MPLIDAQRNYQAFGACDEDARKQVRAPRADEPREPGWRPLDPAVDNFERSFDEAVNVPWPEDLEALYWWRPTYFRLNENRTPVPVPRRPPTNASERLMARILDAVPEAEPIDLAVRSRYEGPAPFVFCRELAPFVLSAYERGDTELALRTVTALNTGLIEGDGEAANCVVIAFLEREDWHDSRMSPLIAAWPTEIRADIEEQIAHVAAHRDT